MKSLFLTLLTLPALAQVQSVKFHYGDDLRWADPNFDDSAWQDGNETIDIHAHLNETWQWARYKVRLPERFLDPVIGWNTALCEVYAEGQLIGKNGHFPPALRTDILEYKTYPIPAGMATPGKVITVAIRLWRYPGADLRRLVGFTFAPQISLHNAGETPIYWSNQRSILRGRFWALAITLALLLVLLTSGAAQFGNREVRLLFAYLALYAIHIIAFIAQYYFPVWILSVASNSLTYAFLYSLQLEIIVVFSGQRRSKWLRLVQALNFMVLLPSFWAALLLEAPVWLPVIGLGQTPYRIVNFIAAAGIVLFQPKKPWAERAIPLALLAAFFAVAVGLGSANAVSFAGVTMNQNIVGNAAFMVVLVAVHLFRLKKSGEVAARLQGQFNAARNVQEMLLSGSGQNSAHFEIETVYRPADEVGGDFFRVIEMPDGGRLVIAGDVSGKGLRAAMLVNVIVGVLLNRKSDEPAAVLEEMNRSLHGQMDGGFVTCCCALFHPDGSVQIANAGNPPPYCKGVEIEVPTGLPLGLTSDFGYESTTLQLQSGDRMVFLSDGVVEAANSKGELFGFERTRSMSGKAAEAISAAAQAWGQNDDISVVAVRRMA